jgi:hypothetical protein
VVCLDTSVARFDRVGLFALGAVARRIVHFSPFLPGWRNWSDVGPYLPTPLPARTARVELPCEIPDLHPLGVSRFRLSSRRLHSVRLHLPRCPSMGKMLAELCFCNGDY